MRITAGRIVTVLAVAAVVAGVGWFLMPQPVPVETAAVVKGRFVASVDEDGKTRVRERYIVAAPLAGRLARIALKPGDKVAADEVVAIIMPPPAPLLDPRTRREAEERLGTVEAARERSKAAVERAQAQAKQANADLDRSRTLVKQGAATVQALERAELMQRVADRDLRAAEFQDHATNHEVEQARALLARYQDNAGTPPERWNVTAPVSGVVLKVPQESETAVQSGAPLLEIGDPRDLEIVTDVLSIDAVEIRPGAAVAIEHWGGPGMLSGRVRRIEPAAFTKISTLGVEEQRVNVLIDMLSPQEQWMALGTDTGSTRGSQCSPTTISRSYRPAPCFAVATIGASMSSMAVVRNCDPSMLSAGPAVSQPSRKDLSKASGSSSTQVIRSVLTYESL